MANLLIASLFFIFIHLFISGTALRKILLNMMGGTAFKAAFALLSLIGVVWMSVAYGRAPHMELWGDLPAIKPVTAFAMFIAFLFVVAGVSTASPTAIGGEMLLTGEEPARGILRVTRHPVMWGTSLWGLVHLMANGDGASLIFFGSLLFLSLMGPLLIDRKRMKLSKRRWDRFAAKTSSFPFIAILQKRNRLKLKEIGLGRFVGGMVVFSLFLYFHAMLFGVPAI
ncbi:MAG: NnrU family protein [Deltaproteobacteria bacterium]|nr:NnrU family protein [Deltaproteobacteria bacterium]